MTDKQTTYRIVKVAAELGVALATVAEHLNKKGFEVDGKPTSKISQEMYDILLKDFRNDKAARDEARQLEISKVREPREVSDIHDKPKTTPKEDESQDFDDDEILIKNTNSHHTPVVEPPASKKEEVKVEKTPEPVKEEPVKETVKPEVIEKTTTTEPIAQNEEKPAPEDGRIDFKVVGKIDLSALNSKTKPAKKDKKEEKPVEKEPVKAEKTEPVPVEKPAEEPVIVSKEKAPEVKPEEVKPVAIKEEKSVVEKPKEVEPPKEPVKEIPIAETPVVKETIKEEVKPVVVDTPKEDSNENASDEKPSVLKPNYEKLQGLKVMGKIELPTQQPKGKKPVASSDGSHEGKKKRKRKTIGPEGNKTTGPNGNGNTNTGVNRTGTTPGGPNRPAPGERRTNINQGNNNPNNKGRFDRNKPNTTGGSGTGPNQKAEITEKQIQDKLKQTLARLQPGGNKSQQGGSRSKLRRQKRDIHATNREDRLREEEADKKILKVTEFISANQLAQMMDIGVNEVITACFSLGMMVSINQRLDAETIAIIADEFGFEVQFVGAEDQETIEEEADDPADLESRAPIVTVMGHVDHGKTSLLDYIRKANVIAGESGGITQHIGAYEVTLENDKKITFLDTPGHEAFTAMRARGAKITDVAIIVIAADDSVMPQTKEAIAHAQAAGVPMVFAINKIDKDGANTDRIREQLAAMDYLVEEWGGKYQCQEISAKKGLNVELLLEKVLLEAEMLDLKANPNRKASGTVVEAQLDKGRGIVATVMVLTGTLRVGDPIIAGVYAGKVRALFNERGKKIDEAGPSTPVTVLGFGGAPQAGDKFVATKTEQEAKEIATKRQQLLREQGLRTQKHITLDEIGRRLAIGNFKELNIIVKGDVDGSVEALSDALLKLSREEIQVNVIHKSVGQISESDVLLASASDAIIVGFQVRPSSQAKKLAEVEGIEIKYYSIIYKAIEEIKDAMEGMLEPDMVEKEVCSVEVRDVFKISKVGTIAGCYVLEGKITRNTKIRLVRDGVVVHTGELDSLKRFKDDVKEVTHGYECGLGIKNFNDIQEGDIIEGFEIVEVKRKLK